MVVTNACSSTSDYSGDNVLILAYFNVLASVFKRIFSHLNTLVSLFFMHNALKTKSVLNFDFTLASPVLNLVVKLYRSVQQWPCLAPT